MSKNDKKQVKQESVQPVQPQQRQRTIEPHRHCPICWERYGGYGTAYSKQGRTTYYKCNKVREGSEFSPCGHTWTAVLRIEAVRVEHRVVDVEGQR